MIQNIDIFKLPITWKVLTLYFYVQLFSILCQKVKVKYYILSPRRRINTDSVFIRSSHELDTYISIYLCGGGEYFVLYNGYTDFKKS